MRAFRAFLFIALIMVVTGCENDYDIDKKLRENFKPQVVLNSVISPDEPVTVKMCWSRRYDDKNPYQTPYPSVANFDIRLYEDGVLVESAEQCDGSFTFAHVPSEGKSYRLEADVPDYGTLKAETSVPRPAQAKVSFVKWKGYYSHFELKEIIVPESKRAIWIRPALQMGDNEQVYPYDIYTISPFPDQINSFLDSDMITNTESNISYEYFIRIPRMNMEACLPLKFCFESYALGSPNYPDWEDILDWDEYGRPIIGWDDDGNPILWEDEGDDEPTEIVVNIITPSDEYDKYYRLIYKQELFNYEADFPIFGETVQVFSNVENGLGIFAGYSVNTTVFDFDGKEL